MEIWLICLSENSQIGFFDFENIVHLFEFLPFHEDNEDTAQQDHTRDTEFSDINCNTERTNPISSDAILNEESIIKLTPIRKIKEKSRSPGHSSNFDQPGIIVYSLKFIKFNFYK